MANIPQNGAEGLNLKVVIDMNDSGNGVALSEEQERAVDVLMSERNVFLTGEAGTGKATVLREFRRRMEGRCIVLAPTGVAAVNVGGVTIHSFLQFKPGLLTPEVIEPFASAQNNWYIDWSLPIF